MLDTAQISLLDRPLPCKRIGCSGTILNTTLRVALALIEYQLRTDSASRLHGICTKCDFESDFTYSEVYNAIPPSFRPTPLAENEFWALVLIAGPSTASGVACFLGERVLVRRIEDTGGAWLGHLETTSTLTPTLGSG